MIKYAFFDFDGTLIDIRKRYYKIFHILSIKFKFKSDVRKIFELKRREINDKVIFAKFVKKNLVDSCVNYKNELLKSERFVYLDKIVPHAIDNLKFCKQNNIKVFLVTKRKNMKILKNQLKTYKILNYFDRLLIKGNTSVQKAEIISHLLKKFKIESGECLLVGDTEEDILTAKANGIISVVIPNGLRNRQFLKLYNPTYLINDILELKKIIQRLNKNNKYRKI
jgi:HAD superfamily hydrolase (TIGR01549 family)